MPARKHFTCTVEGCEKGHKAKGYCNTHDARVRRYGTLKRKYEPLSKSFKDNCIPVTETGCWLWERCLDTHGYGHLEIKTERMSAHRLSWELHRGPIPEGMCVCHKCDTPACVNPDHLFLGTHKDNIHDAMRKGRLYSKNSPKYKAKKRRQEDERNRRGRRTSIEAGRSPGCFAPSTK